MTRRRFRLLVQLHDGEYVCLYREGEWICGACGRGNLGPSPRPGQLCPGRRCSAKVVGLTDLDRRLLGEG